LHLTDITSIWRRGSVVASWLLDLTATSSRRQPCPGISRDAFSDSGEGRWTIQAAIDESAPAPCMIAALYHRFPSSRAKRFRIKGFIRPALPVVGNSAYTSKPSRSLIPMLSSQQIDQAAHHLVDARKAKTPGPCMPEAYRPRITIRLSRFRRVLEMLCETVFV